MDAFKPNVGLWVVSWLMVCVGFVTLGQRATLHWPTKTVDTDAGPMLDQRIHLGPWPNVGPMSKFTLGQRLFYDVGPTCTHYRGLSLAKHSHAIWDYIGI